MTVRQGESGKEMYVATYTDLSNYTDLYIKFTSPSGLSFERSVADGITAPSVDSPALAPNGDFSGGVLPANTYMLYVITENDFTESGEWCICSRYENSNLTPPEIYKTADFKQEVLEGCE